MCSSDLGPRRQDRKRALVFACAGVDVGARGPQPCAVYAGSVGAQEPFSSRQPGFLSLDRQTGALRWILRPEHAETNQMFGFGADAIIGGGRLFAVDLEGVIYAFDDP